MLESFVLPFQITAVVLGVLAVVFVICSPKFGIKTFKAVVIAILVAGMAFIPSCTAIKWVADAFRYGEFKYQTAAEINDDHIEIPPSATDITLHKTWTGHHARFTVELADLQAWLVELQGKYVTAWRNEPMETSAPSNMTQQEFAHEFGQFNWIYPPDNYGLETPYAPNGAGPTIWYSPMQKKAYLRAAYW